ncbi:hypothetical protein JB92DRAFT_2946584 [Gautieria morchelliformis]|nr:hypothetical protein JB92DRAFT_2946584 [Gautieria morchelliformis]
MVKQPRDSYIHRKCNTINHLADALTVPCLIGVQGLLLARTYAISLQNQRVLGVLGLLILGAIILGVYVSALDNCNGTISQVNTVTFNVAVILFDTGVVIITILSSIQTLRLWRKGEIWDKRSLISLVSYQGFIQICAHHNIGCAITNKTSISPILVSLQNSLSIIIICRFHLTLKERHSRLNSPSLPSLSFSSFQAARQSVQNAIVAEFGNPHLSWEDFNADNLEDNVADQEGQQSPEEAGSDGIELDEFPRMTACPGDAELAGQIASGEQLVSLSGTG